MRACTRCFFVFARLPGNVCVCVCLFVLCVCVRICLFSVRVCVCLESASSNRLVVFVSLFRLPATLLTPWQLWLKVMGFIDTVAILAQGMSPGLRSRVLGLFPACGLESHRCSFISPCHGCLIALFRLLQLLLLNEQTVSPKRKNTDTLPEWSKGVDPSSTSASCVGSNPTGVIK